jgi:hypothetical protein
LNRNHGQFAQSGYECITETICPLTIRFAHWRRKAKDDEGLGVLIEREAGLIYPFCATAAPSMTQAAINNSMTTLNCTAFVCLNMTGPHAHAARATGFFRSCGSVIASSAELSRSRTQYPVERDLLSLHSAIRNRT